MRVIEISAFGPPEVLRPSERVTPVPAAGEVSIAVSASGINRPDVLQREGLYPPPAGASDLPGLEVAGVIVSGDAGELRDAGLKLGDRVCALVSGGGYEDHCVAPIGQCLPVPDGLTDDGRLVIIAVQGGRKAQFDAAALQTRRLTITGPTLRARSAAFKAAIARDLRATAWRWIESRLVRPVVFKVFPAAQAAQARALLESNQHVGKLVLSW
jgi:NADPH:quinone reductase-like Zn-dependent oxidoreductase